MCVLRVAAFDGFENSQSGSCVAPRSGFDARFGACDPRLVAVEERQLDLQARPDLEAVLTPPVGIEQGAEADDLSPLPTEPFRSRLEPKLGRAHFGSRAERLFS